MKTLRKQLCALLMAFCMIAPVFVQPASATDSTTNSDLPEGCIVVSEDSTLPITNDFLDILDSDIVNDEGTSPQVNANDRDMGVGVRRITV